MGAWIEILLHKAIEGSVEVAPLVGAWIEINSAKKAFMSDLVAPLVGAWIEITETVNYVESKDCRSSRGSVD